jgi:carboxymethylenebutenolidase
VGVVILPDVRGLHPYYVALAERFAEAGLVAVAIDWFGRTAGLAGTGTREADFDYQPHIGQTTHAGIDADIAAGIEYLRSRTEPGLPVVTVGFCFGGSHSWRQSGGTLDLAGCVGFYGRPSVVGDAAERASKPTVMLIAGADAATPVADQLALAGTMRAAGAEVDDVVYDGAPHSFFDRAFGEWADACQDAWQRVLALTDRVAGRRP